jgi:hypothetical protein
MSQHDRGTEAQSENSQWDRPTGMEIYKYHTYKVKLNGIKNPEKRMVF